MLCLNSSSMLVLACILLLSVYVSSASDGECWYKDSCAGNNIHNTKAECLSYKSCFDASIDTTHPVVCSSLYSCGYMYYYSSNSYTSNTVIKTSDDITCSSKYSCGDSDITSTAGSVACSSQKSCFHATIRGQNVDCSGLESCAITTISAANDVYCTGWKACFDNTINGLYINSADIECSNFESCANSTINNVKSVTCRGDSSCKHAHITSTELFGDGYHSLMGATITSPSDTLNVELIGYKAGKHTTIQCTDGQTCTLKCNGNSCEDLNFQCSSSANCVIQPSECGVVSRIAVADVDYETEEESNRLSAAWRGTGPKPTKAPKIKPSKAPKPSKGPKPTKAPKIKPSKAPKVKKTKAPKPTQWPTPSPTLRPTRNVPENVAPTLPPNYDINSGTICPIYTVGPVTKLAQIKNAIPKQLFDQEESDNSNQDITSELDCNHDYKPECSESFKCTGERLFWCSYAAQQIYGSEACVGCEIVPTADVNCYGDSSCIDATTMSPDNPYSTAEPDVNCYGTKSCYSADNIIPVEGWISCYGFQSCANVVNAKTQISWKTRANVVDWGINCKGKESCINSVLDGEYVNCQGTKACHNAKMINTARVGCNGNHACDTTTFDLMSSGNCDGYESCINSVITSNNRKAKLTLKGQYAAKGTNIYGLQTVYAYGQRSLENAHITSDNKMGIYLLGYESGYGAVITCTDGAYCDLHCGFNGCSNTQFICQSGATCTVFPLECKNDNSVTKTSDGVICPIWTDNGNDYGCYASITSSGDNNIQMDMSNDGGLSFVTMKKCEQTTIRCSYGCSYYHCYEKAWTNTIEISKKTVLKYTVEDSRSYKKSPNYGGFVAAMQIINKQGEIYELVTDNPLTTWDIVETNPKIRNFDESMLNYVSDATDGRVSYSYPSDTYWVWIDPAYSKGGGGGMQVVFEFDFANWIDDLTNHGCWSHTQSNNNINRNDNYINQLQNVEELVENGIEDHYKVELEFEDNNYYAIKMASMNGNSNYNEYSHNYVTYFIVISVAILIFILSKVYSSKCTTKSNSAYSPLLPK